MESDLREENICLVNDCQLDEDQAAFVRRFYYKQLDGYIAPVWFSALKDLNNEPDDCIYLAVKMRKQTDKTHPEYALLQLPVNLVGRFVQLPSRGNQHFIMYIDDVVRCTLPLILLVSITPFLKPMLSSLQRMLKWK